MADQNLMIVMTIQCPHELPIRSMSSVVGREGGLMAAQPWWINIYIPNTLNFTDLLAYYFIFGVFWRQCSLPKLYLCDLMSPVPIY